MNEEGIGSNAMKEISDIFNNRLDFLRVILNLHQI